jgi:hypothetical protein
LTHIRIFRVAVLLVLAPPDGPVPRRAPTLATSTPAATSLRCCASRATSTKPSRSYAAWCAASSKVSATQSSDECARLRLLPAIPRNRERSERVPRRGDDGGVRAPCPRGARPRDAQAESEARAPIQHYYLQWTCAAMGAPVWVDQRSSRRTWWWPGTWPARVAGRARAFVNPRHRL